MTAMIQDIEEAVDNYEISAQKQESLLRSLSTLTVKTVRLRSKSTWIQGMIIKQCKVKCALPKSLWDIEESAMTECTAMHLNDITHEWHKGKEKEQRQIPSDGPPQLACEATNGTLTPLDTVVIKMMRIVTKLDQWETCAV